MSHHMMSRRTICVLIEALVEVEATIEFSLSHHEHSSMVFIVRVGGIIGELSTCGS